MSIYIRHRCWWCKELFDERRMTHQKSGWLCLKCFAYLRSCDGPDMDKED